MISSVVPLLRDRNPSDSQSWIPNERGYGYISKVRSDSSRQRPDNSWHFLSVSVSSHVLAEGLPDVWSVVLIFLVHSSFLISFAYFQV